MTRTLASILIVLFLATTAHAARIADVTRLGNQRTNVITGWGLVFGLKGTGDGGKFLPAMRPLAEMLKRYGNPAGVLELGDAKNVAIVTMTATLPETGARDGDKLDVHVTSIGSSPSLRGGRLFLTPMSMRVLDKDLFAGWVQGPISIEDVASPTVGVVENGCVLEGDFPNGRVDVGGMFKLIIDEPSASWTMSSNIAKIINDSEDGQTWALGDEREGSRRPHPAGRTATPRRLHQPRAAPPGADAERRGPRADQRAHRHGDPHRRRRDQPGGHQPQGADDQHHPPHTDADPAHAGVQTKDVIALDTTNEGGAKLQDLINALDQLKVPIGDRIDIIKELHKTGKLHAKLMIE
jgi:flagellar P-ring protein precursor FlgI